jgi:hypothetical protein
MTTAVSGYGGPNEPPFCRFSARAVNQSVDTATDTIEKLQEIVRTKRRLATEQINQSVSTLTAGLLLPNPLRDDQLNEFPKAGALLFTNPYIKLKGAGKKGKKKKKKGKKGKKKKR